MPTGVEARRIAAIEQVMAHVEAAECVVALVPEADPECRILLLRLLCDELARAHAALTTLSPSHCVL